MCDIMEAAIQEAIEETARKYKHITIEKLLDKNKMSHEEIAKIVSGTVAEVEEVARLKAAQTGYVKTPENSEKFSLFTTPGTTPNLRPLCKKA